MNSYTELNNKILKQILKKFKYHKLEILINKLILKSIKENNKKNKIN